MSDLKQTAVELKERIKDDDLGLVAAGVAFYGFLSVFPALATVISLYGLVADPQSVQNHISALSGTVPEEVLSIVSTRMENLASSKASSLTFGFVFGLLLSLWSANKAMKALAKALNIAYDTEEDRGFVKRNLVTLSLTLLAIIVFIFAMAVVVIVPILVSVFLSQQSTAVLATVLSWLLFIALLTGLFLVLYRYAPAHHQHDSWKSLLPGAVFSSLGFVIASAGFSYFVSNFGKFDAQYGVLGAVVVMMLWLLIGAFIFLVGAELNAERHQPGIRRRKAVA